MTETIILCKKFFFIRNYVLYFWAPKIPIKNLLYSELLYNELKFFSPYKFTIDDFYCIIQMYHRSLILNSHLPTEYAVNYLLEEEKIFKENANALNKEDVLLLQEFQGKISFITVTFVSKLL